MKKKKLKISYGSFLRNSDIVGTKPILVKALAKDMDLELYLGKCGVPGYSWITAVVSVKKKNGEIWKFKYDGEKIKGEKVTVGFKLDLSQLALDCIPYIKLSYSLDYFRKLPLGG